MARFDASNRQMPDMSNPAALDAYIKGFAGYQALTQRVADEGVVLLAEINSAPLWDGKIIPDPLKQ